MEPYLDANYRASSEHPNPGLTSGSAGRSAQGVRLPGAFVAYLVV